MIKMTLAELAVIIDAELFGGNADAEITGVAGYEIAGESDVTFVMDERRLKLAEKSSAIAIISPRNLTSDIKTMLYVDDPRSAFGRAMQLYDWRRLPIPGVERDSHVSQSAMIHARAYVGAGAVLGERAVVSDGAVIGANSYIGDGVEIGQNTIIYPNVTIYAHCIVGSNVIIHSGTVIGADGFGYQPGENGWQKIPHLGYVIIEDDVEIGANTCIDRGTSGTTVIGQGTKIDNLVQIAHNVKIGKNSLIIALVGLAGSVEIGDNVIVAGQTGVLDHVKIADNCKFAVRSGVTKDSKEGESYSGYPAQPHMNELKQQAAMRKLPEILMRMKELEKKVKELELKKREE